MDAARRPSMERRPAPSSACSGRIRRRQRADAPGHGSMQGVVAVELSFCVVNTEQRGLLRYCLDAIARERATVDFETEVLVLDNASQDGSANAARAPPGDDPGDRARRAPRQGRERLRAARSGRAGASACCSTRTRSSSRARPSRCTPRSPPIRRAGAAGAMLVRPDGGQQPSAWRFPSPGTALLTALWLHRSLVVLRAAATRVRTVDWVPVGGDAGAARGRGGDRLLRPRVLRLLRRGRLLPPPRRRRLAHALRPGRARRPPRAARERAACRRAGSSSSRATATATCASTTRALSAALVRWLTAWNYGVRAAGRARPARPRPEALLPSTSRRRCSRRRGEGLSEGADEFNRRLGSGPPADRP